MTLPGTTRPPGPAGSRSTRRRRASAARCRTSRRWYNANVTVNCTTTDNGVGLAVGTLDDLHAVDLGRTRRSERDRAASTQQVCDRLAHCVTAGTGITFKVDRQAPSVTITSPTNGAAYAPARTSPRHSPAATARTAPESQAASGTVATGAAIDTTPGTHVFSVTGRDTAGNATTASVTYSVGYRDLPWVRPDEAAVAGRHRRHQGAAVRRRRPQPVVAEHHADRVGAGHPRPAAAALAELPGQLQQRLRLPVQRRSYIYNLDPTQPLPNGTMLGSGPHIVVLRREGHFARPCIRHRSY